jgi:hypothetical protein
MGSKHSKDEESKLKNKYNLNSKLNQANHHEEITNTPIFKINNPSLVESSNNKNEIISYGDDKHDTDNFSLYQENLLYNSLLRLDNYSLNQEFINDDSSFKIYKPDRINFLYNQNIEEIRKRNKQFTDDIFKPSVKSLIADITKQSAIELFVNLNDYSNEHLQKIDLKNLNLSELDKKIKWKRSQVKIYPIKI